MKHTWWHWHAVAGTAYWNLGHTAGTLRKIGIYFIFRNNWHIDVPWNICKIFYWISFFFCSTHGFDIELYDILYSILCKLYTLRIGVLDWHIHCARVWYEIIKIVEHSLDFHLGSCKCFDEVENVSGIFFYWYRSLFWNFEISLFSFSWWYTLMKNKHQISLYLGLKKMANILLITFSNGFSFKKITVCFSACHTFFIIFPSWYHHEIFRSEWLPCNNRSDVYAKFQGHRSKVKVAEVKTQTSRFGTITPFWFHIW